MGKRGARTGLEPNCAALVVCDYVHVDPVSDRFTTLGTFQEIVADAFPLTLANLGVYVALTDGRGLVTIRLQIVDVDEERLPVWDYVGEADLTDPQAPFELGVNGSDVEFAQPGIYRVQLLVDGATLMERSIVLLSTDEE
jgi:hypothetical protein